MKKYLPLTVVALSLLLALTACGGSRTPLKVINVTITDFTFSPNSFTVYAGDQISFTAQNNGSNVHDFVIMKLGKDISGHFTDADRPNIYWGKENINPGTSVTDTFTAPAEPGQYQIVCAIAGHLEAGMVAKLTVVK